MIAGYYEKVKGWSRANKGDLFTAGVIFFTGLASFGLGRLSAVWPEKEPITISEEASIGLPMVKKGETASAGQAAWQGRFVASKSGKYYYLPS